MPLPEDPVSRKLAEWRQAMEGKKAGVHTHACSEQVLA